MSSALVELSDELELILQVPPDARAALLPGSIPVSLLSDLTYPRVQEFTGDVVTFISKEKPREKLDFSVIKNIAVPDESTVKAVRDLLKKEPTTKGVLCVHVSSFQIVWPVWVVQYWIEIHRIWEAICLWQPGFDWLAQRRKSTNASLKSVSNHVFEALTSIQWDTHLHGFADGHRIDNLAIFLSHEWLRSSNEDMMLTVLRDQLALKSNGENAHQIESTTFAQKLLQIFSNPDDLERDKQYNSAGEWFRRTGGRIEQGRVKSVAFIFNVKLQTGGYTHWVAMVINFASAQILYGDSLQASAPSNLLVAVQRWLAKHTDISFTVQTLPTPHQNDGHSCGLLAVLALGHYYVRDSYAHINARDGDELRLQMLIPILEKHNRCVSAN